MYYDIHTLYSPQESILSLEEYFTFLEGENAQFAALADSNNIHAGVDFFNLCKKKGIKPLIGAQVNFIENLAPKKRAPFKINLFALNKTGYKNLCKLLSLSYEKPNLIPHFRRQHNRVDSSLLEEYNEGIVCINPTLEGVSYSLFEENKHEYLLHLDSLFESIFWGRYFTLISPSYQGDKFKEWCRYVVENQPLNYIIGNSSFYATPNEYEYYDMLVTIRNSQKFSSPDRRKGSPNLFLRTRKELEEFDFGLSEKEIQNGIRFGLELAEKFEFEYDTTLKFPKLDIEDEEEEIKDLVRKGWQRNRKRLIFAPIEDYKKRARYELDVIRKLGYIPYFIVVQDIINSCRKKGIECGPGRGSAAGSLLSYLLGITDVDPLRYNLLFERFLDPSGQRVSPPDIDIDFQASRREEVIEYIHEKYGVNNTVLVGNITLLALKSAIKDVARALDIDFEYINKFTKRIRFGTTSVEEILRDKDLSMFLSDGRIKTVLRFAKHLAGTMRQIGTHAAGVVVAPDDISNYTPTQHVRGSKFSTSHLNKDSLENIGLLKLDVLGSSAVDSLQEMVKLVKEIEGKEIDLSMLDLDDEKIYGNLQQGYTAGLFQVEGGQITELAKRIHPVKHSDICDLVALFRPAVLKSKLHEVYLSNRKKGNKDKFNYIHPLLKESLSDTYGILLFQEQLMESTKILAGFTLAEADQLRKAIGKKRIDVLESLKKKFFEGCKKNGITSDEAEEIFEVYHNATQYGFNKSHSIAYSIVTCRMAWIKHYYPKIFYTCCLNTEQGSADKDSRFRRLRDEMAHKGIYIKPPDVNISTDKFRIFKGGIYCSLGAIKNVGDSFVANLLQERNLNGSYKSIDDLLERLNKNEPISSYQSSFETMAQVGVFDSLEPNRALCVKTMKLFCTKSRKNKAVKEEGLFSSSKLVSKSKLKDYSSLEKKRFEQELIGLVFS